MNIELRIYDLNNHCIQGENKINWFNFSFESNKETLSNILNGNNVKYINLRGEKKNDTQISFQET